jgi:hypothetical protein
MEKKIVMLVSSQPYSQGLVAVRLAVDPSINNPREIATRKTHRDTAILDLADVNIPIQECAQLYRFIYTHTRLYHPITGQRR